MHRCPTVLNRDRARPSRTCPPSRFILDAYPLRDCQGLAWTRQGASATHHCHSPNSSLLPPPPYHPSRGSRASSGIPSIRPLEFASKPVLGIRRALGLSGPRAQVMSASLQPPGPGPGLRSSSEKTGPPGADGDDDRGFQQPHRTILAPLPSPLSEQSHSAPGGKEMGQSSNRTVRLRRKTVTHQHQRRLDVCSLPTFSRQDAWCETLP